MPSVTTKIILCLIFIIICYLYYSYNIKNVTTDNNTVKTTQQATKDALVESIQKVYHNYNGIYLYNPDSDNLYLKRPNPEYNQTSININVINNTSPFLYYYSGKGIDCPDILNNDNSSWKTNSNSTSSVPSNQYILIQDTVNTFSCSNITSSARPEYHAQLLAQCTDTSNKSNQFASYITSARDQEEIYKDIIKKQGNVTALSPSPEICHSPDSKHKSNTGNDPTSSKYLNFADYLSKNKEMIIGLAIPIIGAGSGALSVLTKSERLARVSVVSGVLGHFAMVAMILPGFFENPVNSWEFQKNALNATEMVVQIAVEKLTEFMLARTSTAASGSLMTAVTESATSVVAEMSVGMKALVGFNAVLGGVSAFLTTTQLAGMIADSFDPCKLQSQSMNLTQEYLDVMREAYDKASYIQSKSGLPDRIDPSKICDYKLDCTYVYNNCLSDTEKKQYKDSSEYCSKLGDRDLYNSYVSEYLKSLTINSSGECIGEISNSSLASYFNTYVGGLDWSFISEMNASDLILPDNEQLKVLNLMLAGDNVLAAGYINKHFYYFLSAFIVLLSLIFIV